ncbi:phototropin-2-like [Dorcoceras hygrometricum]|uniref:Phototropin-2-like n=1 Tax=Dorcoceras hygrometricum TaxID=472368 RepID=A0A2Z7CGL2_9LAMI|nr:phototropin-2-like [Dorcoceras hygrometricum]
MIKEVDVKRNLESATMTSAFLLEEVVISNYDVSFISIQQVLISNYEVSNVSRQLDGSTMMTSAVMSSQSAVEQKQYQQAVKDETATEGWWSLGVLAAAGCGIGSVHEMLAGNTIREVESDTIAEQELKIVKRDFGGLNEGIWPKRSLGHQTNFDELCSLDCSGGSSTGLMRKYTSWFRCAEDGSAGATEPAEVDVKRNLESATMTSAFLLEEVVIRNYDVSFISIQQDVISNYDVSNISRQLDGSAMMTSAVMSSQSAVEQKQYQQAVKDETASYYFRSC